MKYVEPKVVFLAQTVIDREGLRQFLEEVGAPGWEADYAASDGEELAEIAGRFCYQSYGVGLNPNVTRVREGNHAYLANLLQQGHGSVLEHASVTLAFLNVSRVLTHELVRHRPGMAYSQVSLRYVRLTDLKAMYPAAFQHDSLKALAAALPEGSALLTRDEANDSWAGGAAYYLSNKFVEVFEYLERAQRDIAAVLRLDDCKDFTLKKKITSAMRRLAPIGLATGILATGNHRAWRHLIEQRTSRHAEEEIRLAFEAVHMRLSSRFPAFYQDASIEQVDGISEITFDNPKV